MAASRRRSRLACWPVTLARGRKEQRWFRSRGASWNAGATGFASGGRSGRSRLGCLQYSAPWPNAGLPVWAVGSAPDVGFEAARVLRPRRAAGAPGLGECQGTSTTAARAPLSRSTRYLCNRRWGQRPTVRCLRLSSAPGVGSQSPTASATPRRTGDKRPGLRCLVVTICHLPGIRIRGRQPDDSPPDGSLDCEDRCTRRRCCDCDVRRTRQPVRPVRSASRASGWVGIA